MNQPPKKKPPMVIKLDDDFSISRDTYQWHLLDYSITNEDNVRPKNPRVSYHTTLNQCLKHVMERQLGATEGTIQDLLNKLDVLTAKMTKCAEGLSNKLESKEE